MNDFLHFLLVFAVSFVSYLIGAYFGRKSCKKESVGDLVVDNSDPDGPYLFLELNGDINHVVSQKEVKLNVKHKNYLTQK